MCVCLCVCVLRREERVCVFREERRGEERSECFLSLGLDM